MSRPQHSAERIQIAVTLRRMRRESGVSREQAAEALNCGLSKIGNIETAISGIKQAELEKLLDLYQADAAQREDLLDVNTEGHRRRPRSKYSVPVAPWIRRVQDVEDIAVEVLYSSFELVPAALQIEPYARALMVAFGRTGDELEKNLELRMAQSRLLTDREPPLRLWAVIGEPALRANIGGPNVMRAQLEHLLKLTEQDNVHVQVMPQNAGAHPLTGCTLTLFRLPDDLPALGIVENPLGVHFIDRPDQVEKIGQCFDYSRAQALGFTATRDLVKTIMLETREK